MRQIWQKLSELFPKIRNKAIQQFDSARQWLLESFQKNPVQMTAGSFAIFVLLFFIVFLWNRQLNAWHPETIDSFSAERTFDDSKLQIVQLTPSGQLESADGLSQIVLVFNKPMAPLTILEEKPSQVKGLFRIDPPIPGVYRWLGSRAQAFIPSNRLNPGTQYTVTVSKGVRSIAGLSLEKEFSGQFKTPELKVQYVYPYKGRTLEYDTEWQIDFNYPVDLASARERIVLESNSGPIPFRVENRKLSNLDSVNRFEREQSIYENKKTILIKPTQKLPRASSIQLTVREGLKPEGGNLGLSKPESYTYETFGPFSVVLSDPAESYDNLWSYRFEFENPVAPEEIQKHVHFVPKVAFASGSYNSRYYSLGEWAVLPGRDYKVTIDSNLLDIYGNRIRSGENFEVSIPGYAKDMDTETGFLTLEKKAKPFMPFYASALKNVKVYSDSISLDSLQQYALKSEIHSADSNGTNWELGLSNTERGTRPFDLSNILQNQGNWLSLTFSAYTPDYNGKEREETRSSWIQTTDMGLTIKEGRSQSDAWLQSMSTGKAVGSATVTAYLGDKKLGECQTDSNGHCSLKTGSAPNDKALYVASKGKDKAFVLGNTHNLPLWSLDVDYSSTADQPVLLGEIVFDRKLYRPGEKVQFLAFLGVRSSGKIHTSQKSLGQIRIEVSSSEGSQLTELKLKPQGENGSVYGEFEIPAEASLGHYTVFITSDGMDQKVRNAVSDTIQVEEFRPVAFSVDTTGLDTKIVGEMMDLTVSGHYLFGAPMQNAPVRYSLSARPYHPRFSKYSDFYFGDEDYAESWEPVAWSVTSAGNAKLDAKGEFKVRIPATPFGNTKTLAAKGYSRTYETEFSATVIDIDEKSVAHTENGVVYAGNHLYGIRILDSYQSQEETFRFELVSLDPDGTSNPSSPQIIIEKREWKTIQVQASDGSLERQNILERIKVEETSLNLSGTLTEYEFKAGEPGSYTITLLEPNGHSYSRATFYAFGPGFVGWDFSEGDTITVQPEKSEYKPGETASILVQSPYPNTYAIVTLERENIFWSKTIELNGNALPVEIPIGEAQIPTAYIGVMLVQPRIQRDPKESKDPTVDLGKPSIKIGYAKISVQSDQYKLPLKILTDKTKYKPREKVHLTIQTEANAEVGIGVSDRAILDLVNYHYADPMRIFYWDWPMGVATLENRSSIINQLSYANKGHSPGGKGWDESKLSGTGGFSQDSEDGVRKRFLPTAYWSPSLSADNSGKISLDFELPDNLTTFRIQAIAGKKGKFNVDSSEIQVQLPLVVQPSLPRFIRPGDSIQLSANITNGTNSSMNLEASWESDLLVGPSRKQTIAIGPGESREVSFPAELNLELYSQKGAESVEGRIRVVSNSGIKDGIQFSFPIYETPPTEAFRITGYTDNLVSEAIRLPEPDKILGGMGNLQLTLSSTALTGLDQGIYFFKENPYQCVEQRASAFLLGMTAGEVLDSLGYKPRQQNGYDFRRIQKFFLDTLPDFQNEDGGFRLWSDTQQNSSPYATAYVLEVLLAAKDANQRGGTNYDFDEEILDRGLDYLEAYLKDPPKEEKNYLIETFAFSNYVLSLADRGLGGLSSYLWEKKDNLSLRGKAFLALAIARQEGISNYKSDARLVELFRSIQNSMDFSTSKILIQEKSHWTWRRSYSSSGSTLGAILLALMKLDAGNPLIPQIVRGAMMDTSGNVWSNSHSVGRLSKSFWVYHRMYEGENPEFDAEASLGKNSILNAKFKKGTLVHSVEKKIPELYRMIQFGTDTPFSFQKSKEKGRLYYNALLSYSPNLEKVKPRDEGMEVHREIFPVGDPTMQLEGTFQRGKTYLVRVTVITPRPIFHFVLDDPIPSLFDIVNTSFSTEGTAFHRILQTKRNKDNWWDSEVRYQYKDKGVVLTQEYMSEGIHEFFYLVRPVVKGKALYPAAKAFPMYETEIFGRTGQGIAVVE